MTNEKRKMTEIGKIKMIREAYEKLLIKEKLSDEESSLLLATAMLLIKDYDNNRNMKMSFEFAYEIILRYSIEYRDFAPLLDFAVNYGFFPLVDYILLFESVGSQGISDIISMSRIEKYKTKHFVATLQQYNAFQGVLSTEEGNVSFVAPTSFGKSELIVRHIGESFSTNKRIAIIVPSKSLLMQTYKVVKSQIKDIKIILHDQMYAGEECFIAVLTQERALRLMEKNKIALDAIYVDEAHNLFQKDMRNRLLSRLIRLCKVRKEQCDVLYFSPLVQDSQHLRVLGVNHIDEYRVDFNIKIPEYHLYKNSEHFIYNRFFNEYYIVVGRYSHEYEYIKNQAGAKNLLYFYSPKKMERSAEEFANSIEELNDYETEEIISTLKKYVHEEFKMIRLIRKGIIYLHGKLPEYIKEYLEYKVGKVSSIKYLFANSVLLEGINLPIDTLFVMDAYGLSQNKLINLIGRVNRLNSIFGQTPDVLKLFPRIHFVKNPECKQNMENYIKLLRDDSIKDKIENPFLESYIQKEMDEKKRKSIEKMKMDEVVYFENIDDSIGVLYQKLVALSLNEQLELNRTSIELLLYRINNFVKEEGFEKKE